MEDQPLRRWAGFMLGRMGRRRLAALVGRDGGCELGMEEACDGAGLGVSVAARWTCGFVGPDAFVRALSNVVAKNSLKRRSRLSFRRWRR